MNQSDKGKADDESTKMLMEQYKLRCQEMLVMVPLNRTHVRNFQIIAGAILGGTALALSRPGSLPSEENWWLWLAFAAFLPVVATYLMLDILNIMYIMQMVAEEIASIECRLNRSLGRELFTWERRISQQFFERRSPIPRVVNPGWYIGAFGMTIYTLLTLVVPGFTITSVWRTSSSLRASGFAQVRIALCSLVVILIAIACWVVLSHIALRLRGMRRLVKAWMDAEINSDGRNNGKARGQATAEAAAKS
jgi:hypothetical protein